MIILERTQPIFAVVLGKIFNNYCHLWHFQREQRLRTALPDAEAEAEADADADADADMGGVGSSGNTRHANMLNSSSSSSGRSRSSSCPEWRMESGVWRVEDAAQVDYAA